MNITNTYTQWIDSNGEIHEYDIDWLIQIGTPLDEYGNDMHLYSKELLIQEQQVTK